jgi:hypothetical protein
MKSKVVGVIITAQAGLVLWFISYTYANIDALKTWRAAQEATAISLKEWDQVRSALLKSSLTLENLAVLPAEIDSLDVRLNAAERDLAVLRAISHP